MPPVLITRPTTGDLVPAGMHARSLEELDEQNLLIGCPDCARDHEWTPADAVIPAQ